MVEGHGCRKKDKTAVLRQSDLPDTTPAEQQDKPQELQQNMSSFCQRTFDSSGKVTFADDQ